MDSDVEQIVCIVGLGYVGLPLAECFSRHTKVIGYDINKDTIDRLKNKNMNIEFTNDANQIKIADFVIIAVPTPVDKSKDPDLSYVISASKTVGQNIKKGVTVILESTVYPGVTEDIVRPILEKESGMRCGEDFKIGYSPERINPGDDEHRLENITKIISGMDKDAILKIYDLYSLITNVYIAEDIKIAEAAKVIENIQRDLNIALMNELSLIFNRIGLNTKKVLKAAETKWNFGRYTPGLVGGHCIPVDPYYLVHKAKELDYHPQVILSGRAINDYMPKFIGEMVIKELNKVGKVIKNSKVLIMGLTYKENVPDIRESPVKDLIKELKEFGINIFGYDPLLDSKTIEDFQVSPIDKLNIKVDCIIITVIHNQFKDITIEDLRKILNSNPILFDIRGLYNKEDAENKGFCYMTL